MIFFISTKRINLLNLRQSLERLVIFEKGFLKLLHLHMLLKQKSPSFPRNLALGTFGDSVLKKVKLLYLLYSMDQSCCFLHLIKQNYLLRNFLRTLILMILISLYLFCFLELIQNRRIYP